MYDLNKTETIRHTRHARVIFFLVEAPGSTSSTRSTLNSYDKVNRTILFGYIQPIVKQKIEIVSPNKELLLISTLQ